MTFGYNVVVISGFMIDGLGLTGNQLIAYSIIYNFTQDKEFHSIKNSYFEKWISLSQQGVSWIISRLKEKGLIEIQKRGRTNYYRICQEPIEAYAKKVASAEEEVSGKDGVERVLPLLPKIDVAIVGEPTGMQPAIAEKGLMVIDGYTKGVSGHAARNEGVNAIYKALDDLVWLRDYKFRKESPLLGFSKMTVTQVESGTQHNVIPDSLHFVIDVRTNEYYQNEFVFSFLQKHMQNSILKARSFRLHSSSIPADHPLVKRCVKMGMKPFGSPTLSDQALMPFPSFKLGPGESSRSHSANEFIRISEIERALDTYLKIIL